MAYNPFHADLIGSGYDALASQRYNWGQANRAVEEANLSRKAAAEQNANNYFARLSDLERGNQDVMVQDRRYQDSLARDAALMKRREYEFGVNRTDTAAANAANLRFAEKELTAKEKADKAYDFTLQQERENEIDTEGQSLATEYLALKSAVTAIEQQKLANEARIESLQAMIDAESGKKEKLKNPLMGSWGQQLTEEKRKRDKELLPNLQKLSVGFEKIKVKMENRQFVPDDENGVLIHKPTKKPFVFRMPEKFDVAGFDNPRPEDAIGYTFGNPAAAVVPTNPFAMTGNQGGGYIPTTTSRKTLDKAAAIAILDRARGDKELARRLAKEAGYSF